jgi:hypothetical protein
MYIERYVTSSFEIILSLIVGLLLSQVIAGASAAAAAVTLGKDDHPAGLLLRNIFCCLQSQEHNIHFRSIVVRYTTLETAVYL